ncbi:MAG: alanyl-tRNA editing protein [Egibacteraceae bacterium]
MRPGSQTELLFATDAYLRRFESEVLAVNAEASRVALARTGFYPGGGGQPADTGVLRWDAGGNETPSVEVVGARREQGVVWHRLADGEPCPEPGMLLEGQLDWERRHLLMRTHTALHILCGVIWQQFGVAVTGGNMEPGKGRLDFSLDAISVELGQQIESRMNAEVARARSVVVEFLDRSEADADPALIRTQANLIPAAIDPLRIIDIVGLDKQADGGTHVASTAEVGGIRVVKTESKGRDNKRIRIALDDRQSVRE